MDIKDIKVTVEGEVNHLDIRQGKLPEVHVPGKIEVKNHVISSAKEFLSKKGVNEEYISDSYILYSVQNRYLSLNYNSRAVNPDYVHGVLKLHPDLEKFEINSGRTYSTMQLAEFIRMSRHFFETRDTAMKLVNELRNFVAKVEKEVERADDKRANSRILLAQKVVSNIPTEFTLLLPIFIGSDKVPVKVEIDINANDLSCSLVSPDLKELIDTESKAIIDDQLEGIKELYPELKIFQS